MLKVRMEIIKLHINSNYAIDFDGGKTNEGFWGYPHIAIVFRGYNTRITGT
jgi:hypothetical protein